MAEAVNNDYIVARKSQLKYYRSIPLYYCSLNGTFVLYKPAGTTLADMRLEARRMPEKLYIKKSDKLRGIREVQSVFNRQLKDDITANNPEKVKETIVNIMEETLSEPRSGSLEGVTATVNILVSDYARESNVVQNLLFVSDTDYTTVLHSINVMALALGYAAYMNFSMAQKRILGLCALLHDVGKTKINTELLSAPRKLTDAEFAEIKRHTTLGYQILDRCKFGNPEIKLTALHHHEKLDGSGYPHGNKNISRFSQLIGFIDCYEALTNDDRPYRCALDPFKALYLIKKDVENGKFDRQIFEKFAYSLNSLSAN